MPIQKCLCMFIVTLIVAFCCDVENLITEQVEAAIINSLPGGTPGGSTLTGFGNNPPNSTYMAQSFTALPGQLQSLVFPIIGPAKFRVLLTETTGSGEDESSTIRPTTVLFESNDIVIPPNDTFFAPVLFMSAGNSISGGDAFWLNLATGDRAADFASPVRTDPNQTAVWNHSGSDLSLCLTFTGIDGITCTGQTLIAPDFNPIYLNAAQAVMVDFGGIDLVDGNTYAVVLDGAIFAVHPELVELGKEAQPLILPGDIVWLDRGGENLNTRIVIIDPKTGAQTVFASGGLLAEGYSTDMAFDITGDLLIAQPLANPGVPIPRRIVRVDRKSAVQSVVSSGGLLSEGVGAGFFGMAVEPDGNILVSDFGSGIIRIDPETGNQTLFSTSHSIADLVVDNGTIWALQQNPSFNILQIDRSTAAESILPVDFSLIPGIYSLGDSHKIDLAPDGDLLVAGLSLSENDNPDISAVRIDKATGIASAVVDDMPIPHEFFRDVAVENNGSVLLAGLLFVDPAALMPVYGVTRIDPTTGNFDFVSSGGLLDFPEGILVAPNFLSDKKTICHKKKTITLATAALSSHLAHGDTLGPCD